MEQKIYFSNSKGDKLCGVLSEPAGRKDVAIIICHGFMSDKNGESSQALQKELNKRNISTLRFDFYGHGESDGAFEDVTVTEAADDALNAIAYLKNKGYKIGLVGTSFGGIAAIVAASKSKDLFVLCLRCPVSGYWDKELHKGGEAGIKEWKKQGYEEYYDLEGKAHKLNYSFIEDFSKNNGYEAAEKIKTPTIIVHGDADEVVPVAQSKRLAKVIKASRLEIIKGADHNFSRESDFKESISLVAEFIMKHGKA
ncbi:MAG: alpha/beta fold hydrolase [Candidatus Aenigmatarchaeota archaeon]